MIYDKPLRDTFSPKSDAELKRALRQSCVECGSVHELRDTLEMGSRRQAQLIAFHHLDPGKEHKICAACFRLLVED